jgi:hypothetical protein
VHATTFNYSHQDVTVAIERHGWMRSMPAALAARSPLVDGDASGAEFRHGVRVDRSASTAWRARHYGKHLGQVDATS